MKNAVTVSKMDAVRNGISSGMKLMQITAWPKPQALWIKLPERAMSAVRPSTVNVTPSCLSRAAGELDDALHILAKRVARVLADLP